MDKEQGYAPEDGFEVDSRESLVDFDLTDSAELWLLQFPNNQLPDFNDKELSIHLNPEGCLGSFESSGKVYEMVSSAVQEPNETVFASSGSQSKILGKISRRVSLVHFPEPKELEEQEAEKKKKKLSQSGRSSIMNSSHHSTPTSKQRGSSISKGRASTHSSRPRSSLSEAGEPTTSSRKKPRKDDSVW